MRYPDRVGPCDLLDPQTLASLTEGFEPDLADEEDLSGHSRDGNEQLRCVRYYDSTPDPAKPEESTTREILLTAWRFNNTELQSCVDAAHGVFAGLQDQQAAHDLSRLADIAEEAIVSSRSDNTPSGIGAGLLRDGNVVVEVDVTQYSYPHQPADVHEQQARQAAEQLLRGAATRLTTFRR